MRPFRGADAGTDLPVNASLRFELLFLAAVAVRDRDPRAAAIGFQPVAGGMAAALPFVDELLSGHTATALDDVVEAIGRRR